ncbi:MAG: hypothetical protein AAFV29_20825, partial [Myxococcota bacterium]
PVATTWTDVLWHVMQPPDEPGPEDPSASGGCMTCHSTSVQVVATGMSETSPGEYDATYHEEAVCDDFSYDFEGEDTSGDGFCDQ